VWERERVRVRVRVRRASQLFGDGIITSNKKRADGSRWVAGGLLPPPTLTALPPPTQAEKRQRQFAGTGLWWCGPLISGALGIWQQQVRERGKGICHAL
jgi:hypothetical protein